MDLNIQKLTKTYPNKIRALNDLTLDISAGMFGLLGPNGAGKSTLMRTLATLQMPDSGLVLFNGSNIFKNRIPFRQQLGYLPQEFGVYPRHSARRLLDYFAVLKGITSKKDRNFLIDEVLELTNLVDVQNKAVSNFSGGMKQRFGIAQLLLNKPRLIIVDEPTAGLDPEERRRFLNVLRAVGSENIVIFSTHIVEDVTDLCNDMAIINKGELLKRSTPRKALDEIKNAVWEKKILPDELSTYKSQENFISSHYTENNILLIRIFSEKPPGDGYRQIKPGLEDAYIITLNNKS